MEDWVVNIIVGLVSAVLGFAGGFFVRTYQFKIKQTIKGDGNKQGVEIHNNDKTN